jgi:hypothetical protein
LSSNGKDASFHVKKATVVQTITPEASSGHQNDLDERLRFLNESEPIAVHHHHHHHHCLFLVHFLLRCGGDIYDTTYSSWGFIKSYESNYLKEQHVWAHDDDYSITLAARRASEQHHGIFEKQGFLSNTVAKEVLTLFPL